MWADGIDGDGDGELLPGGARASRIGEMLGFQLCCVHSASGKAYFSRNLRLLLAKCVLFPIDMPIPVQRLTTGC